MSQFNEHEYILEYFSDRLIPGRFLDIGAYDGIDLSNTRPLYEAGWKGVLVEPNAENFVKLGKNYPSESGCVLVNAGIGKWNGLYPFWECIGDYPSTFIGERKEHFSKAPYRQVYAAMVTVDTLLRALGTHAFDFINVDAEGLCPEIINGLRCANAQTSMLCVEMDPEPQIPYMKQILRNMGLTDQRVIGGNLLAARPK